MSVLLKTKTATTLWKGVVSRTLMSGGDFYQVASISDTTMFDVGGSFVKGKIIDQSIDLRSARPGDIINVPFEITVNESYRDFWQSAFYSYDRINTSTPFAHSLGLQNEVLPFNLMLFLSGSMSHADQAKLQTGFQNGVYHYPGFAGDTFKKRFLVRKLRTTSDQKHSVITIHCEIMNQSGLVVFSCDKTMMFPFQVPPSIEEVLSEEVAHRSFFLEHLVQQATVLQTKGSQTLSNLRPGQLLLHTLSRPLTLTHSMQLASLARLTHEKHFNTLKNSAEALLVPGGLVLAMSCALTARDLHECLYEKLVECSFPNNLSPNDTVGALTFVQALEEHIGGDIEAVCVRTIGLKNIDVPEVLGDKPLPMELFLTELTQLRPAAVEELVLEHCPVLHHRIVCIADRKVYRQAAKQPPFLL